MNVHGAALAVEVVAPHLGDELFPGEYCAHVVQKRAEQFEFLERQLDFFAVNLHNVFGRIDIQLTDRVFSCRNGVGAAQERFDPGDEFHRAEGLCEVVVGAAVQTYHLVVFRALGGEHDNRQPGVLGIRPDL